MVDTPHFPLSDAESAMIGTEIKRLTTGKITLEAISLLTMYLPADLRLTKKAELKDIQKSIDDEDDDYDETSMTSGSSQASSPASSSSSRSSTKSTDDISLRPAPPKTQIIPATRKTSKPANNDGDQNRDGFRTAKAKRRRDPESPKLASEEKLPPDKTSATRALDDARQPTTTTPPTITALLGPAPTPAAQLPSAPPKKDKVPPIMLHRKPDYRAVKRDLMLSGITITAAKDLRDHIRIKFSTPNEFRRATRLLDKKSIPFHCYPLAEEKTLKIVVKGIPYDYSEIQILEIIKAEGYPIIRAQRMKQGNKRLPIPQTLIGMAKTPRGREYFQVKKIDDLDIEILNLKRKTQAGQCHNCQGFGHSSSGCHAPPKCVKCAEGHLTAACTKTHEDGPARCANCDDDHPANYRGCSKNPSAGKPATMAAN